LPSSLHFAAEAGKGGSESEEGDREGNEDEIVHAGIIA
jgi:hypothetical protein